jgi:hypothetical protein
MARLFDDELPDLYGARAGPLTPPFPTISPL